MLESRRKRLHGLFKTLIVTYCYFGLLTSCYLLESFNFDFSLSILQLLFFLLLCRCILEQNESLTYNDISASCFQITK
jgi:hypothetical protein